MPTRFKRPAKRVLQALLGMAGMTALAAPIAELTAPVSAVAQEAERVKSTAEQRESVSITVYNQNFGLVREVRGLPVGRGLSELEFGDVASSIQPETVHIRAIGRGADIDVLEQNYQYDLLSPQKLLEKYVGRTVKLARWNPAAEREEWIDAEVLSVNQGTIFKIDEGITYNYPGRIIFPEVPENLIARPTLLWLLNSRTDQPRAEVSYLTSGLNWKADYVMVVDDKDEHGDLTGWVTLTNHSGTSFKNAQLKLVAGDVQRVVGGARNRRDYDMLRAAAVAEDAAGFAEEGFFEYHLYTLGRPTTVLQNEQKQVRLLEASGFDIDKRLIFYGAPYYYRGSYGQVMSNQKVGVFLDFENSETNQLGMALPAGIVRVYKKDSSGAQQFIGEDRIDHTPRDETLRIKMGEAFDVVGDRKQMEYSVISSCVSESSWEIELRNHKDEAVEVDVMEPIGGDWRILSSSHQATKLDANTFRFRVDIPSRGETTIRYRVRVRWC